MSSGHFIPISVGRGGECNGIRRSLLAFWAITEVSVAVWHMFFGEPMPEEPEETALAKTDSLGPLDKRLNRESTDTRPAEPRFGEGQQERMMGRSDEEREGTRAHFD